MLYILSLQYCMDVKPVIRTNIDGTFILREPSLKNRRALWENYAGIIPDFSTFCEIMDQITDDYTALYIHNATQSNKLEDWVYSDNSKLLKIMKGRIGLYVPLHIYTTTHSLQRLCVST